MKTIDGVPFECTKCGECCRWDGVVLITPSDAKKLSKHLGMQASDFVKKYTNNNHTLVNKEDSQDCIFLDNNKCSVYEARPEQCETFPQKFNSKCPGFRVDRSERMKDYTAAIKMVQEKMAQSEDYTRQVMDNLYKDLNSSIKTASVASMAIEAGIDSYLSNSTVKIASLDDLFSFDRVDKQHLIHKATRDLWAIDTDKSGNVQITRLFDNSGDPIKG
jgi:Fe-S-cluster containining protein